MKNAIRKVFVSALALTFMTGFLGTQAAAASKTKTDDASSSYAVLGLEDMPECDYLDTILTYHYIQTSDYYAMGTKTERTEAVDGINTYTKDAYSTSYSVDGHIVSIDENSKMYTEYTMGESMIKMAKENLEASLKTGKPKLFDRVFQKKGKEEIPQYSEDGDNKEYEYYEYLTEASSGEMTTSKTERFYMKNGDVFAVYTRASAGTMEVEATQVIKSISEKIPKGTFRIPDLSGYKKYGQDEGGTEDPDRTDDSDETKETDKTDKTDKTKKTKKKDD